MLYNMIHSILSIRFYNTYSEIMANKHFIFIPYSYILYSLCFTIHIISIYLSTQINRRKAS